MSASKRAPLSIRCAGQRKIHRYNGEIRACPLNDGKVGCVCKYCGACRHCGFIHDRSRRWAEAHRLLDLVIDTKVRLWVGAPEDEEDALSRELERVEDAMRDTVLKIAETAAKKGGRS